MSFRIHDVESAPAASRPVLERVEADMGFVPNLIGVLAESPAAVETYVSVGRALRLGSLTPGEQQVVAIAVSAENRCSYCVAAHSTAAEAHGLARDVLCDLRDGDPLPDPRLEALRRFTLALVGKRGLVDAADLEAFHGAGYGRAHVLDVITVIAQKTLSNYANHVARTPVDAAFASHDWKPSCVAAGS